MSAYSSTKDNRRKVLHVAMYREVEQRVSEITARLKYHLAEELTEALVYTDELYQLEESWTHDP